MNQPTSEGLKGRYNTAQGNALGKNHTPQSALKGRHMGQIQRTVYAAFHGC
jgi:hypothetical protein